MKPEGSKKEKNTRKQRQRSRGSKGAGREQSEKKSEFCKVYKKELRVISAISAGIKKEFSEQHKKEPAPNIPQYKKGSEYFPIV